MIKNAVKVIKQRQEAVNEQIKNLKAEAKKIENALSILETLGSDVVTKKAAAAKPPKTKKRKMSAAGRKAIAAGAKARWAKIRAEKAGKAAPGKATKAPKAAKGKRAKNKISLMEVVLKVLEVEKAKSIPDIIVAVADAGYVSKSKNFATIIGTTLRQAGKRSFGSDVGCMR